MGGRFGHTWIGHEASPNEDYLATIEINDQGALGGRTTIYIQNQMEINLVIGTLRARTHQIYLGRFSEADEWSLEWQDNDYLYIFYRTQSMVFRRDGRNWTRVLKED